MRRAAVLAILLVLALGGVAQAKGPVDTVSGRYTYLNVNSDVTKAVTFQVKVGDLVQGSFSWASGDQYASGPVTCAIVEGADAWLAGPITDGTFGDGMGFSFRVHDGDVGRGGGDWAVQGPDTLDYVLAVCGAMDTSGDEFADLFPIQSGGLKVSDK